MIAFSCVLALICVVAGQSTKNCPTSCRADGTIGKCLKLPFNKYTCIPMYVTKCPDTCKLGMADGICAGPAANYRCDPAPKCPTGCLLKDGRVGECKQLGSSGLPTKIYGCLDKNPPPPVCPKGCQLPGGKPGTCVVTGAKPGTFPIQYSYACKTPELTTKCPDSCTRVGGVPGKCVPMTTGLPPKLTFKCGELKCPDGCVLANNRVGKCSIIETKMVGLVKVPVLGCVATAAPPDVCSKEGAPCKDNTGKCTTLKGSLVCTPNQDPVPEPTKDACNDVCTADERCVRVGQQPNGDGVHRCEPKSAPSPCAGANEGDECEIVKNQMGKCMLDGSELTCQREIGGTCTDPCLTKDQRVGECVAVGMDDDERPILECSPLPDTGNENSCSLGSVCSVNGESGVCQLGLGGAATCQAQQQVAVTNKPASSSNTRAPPSDEPLNQGGSGGRKTSPAVTPRFIHSSVLALVGALVVL